MEKTNVELLTEENPLLIKLIQDYLKKDESETLESFCGEMLDLCSMTDRVQTFMNECTNMSKTNYTLDVIKELIKKRKKSELNDFIETTLEDFNGMELDGDYKGMVSLGEVKDYLTECIEE